MIVVAVWTSDCVEGGADRAGTVKGEDDVILCVDKKKFLSSLEIRLAFKIRICRILVSLSLGEESRVIFSPFS